MIMCIRIILARVFRCEMLIKKGRRALVTYNPRSRFPYEVSYYSRGDHCMNAHKRRSYALEHFYNIEKRW